MRFFSVQVGGQSARVTFSYTMARKRVSSGGKGLWIGIAAAVGCFVLLALLLVKLVFGDLLQNSSGNSSSGAGAVSALDLEVYKENARGLTGNLYQLSGEVQETLRWTADRGRLISLDCRDDATDVLLPVHVPQQFRDVNIERGASLTMTVRVSRDGTLVAEGVEG